MIEPGFLFYFLYSNQTVKDECGQESVTGFFRQIKREMETGPQNLLKFDQNQFIPMRPNDLKTT